MKNIKKICLGIMSIGVSLIFVSCSPENLNGYQHNTANSFSIIDTIGDSEFLSSLFYMDPEDQARMNEVLVDTMQDVPESATISLLGFLEQLLGDSNSPVQDSLKESRSLVYRIINQDKLDTDLSGDYANDLYSFMDRMKDVNVDVKDYMSDITKKSINYMDYYNTNNPDELEKNLQLLADMLAPKYSAGVRQKDAAIILTALNEAIGKSALRNETAAEGIDQLVVNLAALGKDKDLQDCMLSMLEEMPAMAASKVNYMDGATAKSKDSYTLLDDLLKSFNKYFMIGGAGHINEYATMDLAKTPSEIWPALKNMLSRSDNPNAMFKTKNGEEPVYLLDVIAQHLSRLDLKLGEKDIEKSLLTMMQYDGNGRLRYVTPDQYTKGMRADTKARPYSMMDQTVFTLMAASNYGFRDGKDQTERGAPNNGVMTMADSLISMGTEKEGLTAAWGMLFKQAGCEYTFRDNEPFSKDSNWADGQEYWMSANGICLDTLQGQSLGDVGIKEGGQGIDQQWDSFIPKSNNGIREVNTGRFSLGWIGRACWEGEGPYYYIPADAQPETISVQVNFTQQDVTNGYRTKVSRGGNRAVDFADIGYPKIDSNGNSVKEIKNVYKVYSPNGKLYGYQDATAKEIFYECKFLPRWRTDYFLGGYYYFGSKFVVADNYLSDGDTGIVPGFNIKDLGSDGGSSRCFIYDEILPNGENSGVAAKSAAAIPLRICSSQQEAMYKNFQWLCYYKKFVFIIPMSAEIAGGMARMFIYTVAEMNGLSGMVAGKKTSGGNNKWQKNTGSGLSYHPADYRVAALSSKLIDTAYGALGNGSMTPDVIGANFGGVERMAFTQPSDTTGPEWGAGNYSPVRPDEINFNKFNDDSAVLTAREKEVKNQLSPMFPFIAAFMGVLHENASYSYNSNTRQVSTMNPLQGLTDNLIPAIAQPMFYFDTTGTNSGGSPKDFYRPRIWGANNDGDDDRDFLYPSTSSNVTNVGRDKFFSPKPLQTMTSVMIDGEDTAIKGDGIMTVLPQTTLARKGMGMLELMGQPKFANERKEIFSGLEKALSAADVNGRKYIDSNNQVATVNLANTPEVIDLTKLMNTLMYGWQEGEIIGGAGYKYGGLGGFVGRMVDTDAQINPATGKYYSWERFEKMTAMSLPLISGSTQCGNTYNIFGSLTEVIKTSMKADVTLTAQDAAALRHTLGILGYWYDDTTSSWQSATELEHILMNELPTMITLAKPNLDILVSLGPKFTKKDGLIDVMMGMDKNKKFDYTSEEMFGDIYKLLCNEKLTDPNSIFWIDLVDLLGDARNLMLADPYQMDNNRMFKPDNSNVLSAPYSTFVNVLENN